MPSAAAGSAMIMMIQPVTSATSIIRAANPTIQKPFTEAAIRDALMKAIGVAEF